VFFGGEAAFAVENAQIVGSGHVGFEGVAFEAAGNEVAIGIASGADTRDHVIEAADVRGSAAKTIEADAAFAIVKSFAEGPSAHEVGGFESGRRSGIGRGAVEVMVIGDDGVAGVESGDLLGAAHLDDVAEFAAFDEAESAEFIEATDGQADGSTGKAETFGDGADGKREARFVDDERRRR